MHDINEGTLYTFQTVLKLQQRMMHYFLNLDTPFMLGACKTSLLGVFHQLPHELQGSVLVKDANI